MDHAMMMNGRVLIEAQQKDFCFDFWAKRAAAFAICLSVFAILKASSVWL